MPGVRFTNRRNLPNGVFSTTFGTTENPISDGSLWVNGGTLGLDWNNMRVSGGVAFGTQSGTSGLYDDSVSVLPGAWTNDQYVEAVVHNGNANSTAFEEVELWVRTSITAHSIRGVETNFRCTSDGSQYIGVVRWNGPLGSFDQYGVNDTGPGIVENDLIAVSVIGNTHRVYVNGVLITTHDLSSLGGYVPTSGFPGMGHWYRINGAVGTAASDYGLKSFSTYNL